MKPGDVISFFKLIHEIGIGGFGSVWMVQSTEDNEFYAMKIEPEEATKKSLQFESVLLKKLQNSDYFPKLVLDGQDNDFYFLVMELCGPNLSTVSSSLPGNHFQNNYIYKLADDMLHCIEEFHTKGYVHRDIKPQNFVTRFKGKTAICLIDYGISKLYVDPKTGQHFPARDHVNIAGSPVFSSPNNHDRIEQSRRDDLYAWLYSICSLSEVGLPWNQDNSIQEIGDLKKQHPISQLVAPLGDEIVQIAKHIESLQYEDTPNYSWIHSQLHNKINSNKTEFPYQWMSLEPIPQENPDPKKKPTHLPIFEETNLDPTHFLLSLTKYEDIPQKKNCLLI